MNYASWIEEKNLKKTFIMATLASTLVGTFTASMGLYDRVSDKRQQHKQKARDVKQDGEIKQLKDEFTKAQKQAEERQQEIDRLKNGGGGGGGGRGYGGRGDDDVGYNLGRDAAMVQRMYDDGFGRYGSRFAQGDAIAENQLQAQIISLQQTVISVLQDALAHDRQLTRADQAKLIAASNAAREGSLDALHQAQQRLSSGSTRSASPQRSIAAPPPPPSMHAPPPPRAPSAIMDVGDHLFCRYALDLQYTRDMPLSSNFAPGGSCACPACNMPLDVTADDFWMIGKRTNLPDGYVEVREFRVGQRFALKCHTPDGEYACTICNRNRDVDAICRTVDSLVKHVGTFHDVEELEREPDLKEVVVDERKRVAEARKESPPRRREFEFEERRFEERRSSPPHGLRASSEVGRREFEFEERRGSPMARSEVGSRREVEYAAYR